MEGSDPSLAPNSPAGLRGAGRVKTCWAGSPREGGRTHPPVLSRWPWKDKEGGRVRAEGVERKPVGKEKMWWGGNEVGGTDLQVDKSDSKRVLMTLPSGDTTFLHRWATVLPHRGARTKCGDRPASVPLPQYPPITLHHEGLTRRHSWSILSLLYALHSHSCP